MDALLTLQEKKKNAKGSYVTGSNKPGMSLKGKITILLQSL